MNEVALALMKAAPGWAEHPIDKTIYVFQYGDAKIKILRNGDWECRAVKGEQQKFWAGSALGLEEFLNNFNANN